MARHCQAPCLFDKRSQFDLYKALRTCNFRVSLVGYVSKEKKPQKECSQLGFP